MNRMYGHDIQRVLSLFRQAGHAVTDYPEMIWGPWLLHERLFSDLTHIESAERRIFERRQHLHAQWKKKETEAQERKQEKKEMKEENDKQKRKAKKEEGANISATTKTTNGSASTYVHTDTTKQEQTIFISNLDQSIQEDTIREHFKNVIFS